MKFGKIYVKRFVAHRIKVSLERLNNEVPHRCRCVFSRNRARGERENVRKFILHPVKVTRSRRRRRKKKIDNFPLTGGEQLHASWDKVPCVSLDASPRTRGFSSQLSGDADDNEHARVACARYLPLSRADYSTRGIISPSSSGSWQRDLLLGTPVHKATPFVREFLYFVSRASSPPPPSPFASRRVPTSRILLLLDCRRLQRRESSL